MRSGSFLLGIAILLATSPQSTSAAPAEDEAESSEDAAYDVVIVPLTEKELDRLLAHRLNPGMQDTFAQFSNMFFALSRIQLPKAIALSAKSERVAATPLSSPFPASYKPTLREFLDAIALQSMSEWSYAPAGVAMRSDQPGEQVDHIAPFEFTFKQRPKPYDFELAEGWKGIDRGNWLMLSPPDFPVGLDIYEMGTYSTEDNKAEAELHETVRRDVALEWANRVSEGIKLEDLREAKVGKYDALYFEAMIPSQLKKDIRWRHWVFMVDNACYFIVSTILPENETKIFPDVEAMLATFHVEGREAEGPHTAVKEPEPGGGDPAPSPRAKE
jgi:hypothetical protein